MLVYASISIKAASAIIKLQHKIVVRPGAVYLLSRALTTLLYRNIIIIEKSLTIFVVISKESPMLANN